MKTFFARNLFTIYIALLIAFSLVTFIYCYSHGQLNLANPDARSRLNIALRVTQNITPGLVQLGGVWLPFPQFFEVPLVLFESLHQSGIAGYLVSGTAFVIGGIFIYKIALSVSKSVRVALLAGLLYMTSINLLYLQTTAMAETLFVCSVLGAVYALIRWSKTQQLVYLPIAGMWITIATLTRYEGYFVLLASFTVVIILSLRNRKKLEANVFLFSTVAFFGAAMWALYNWLIFGNPVQSFLIYLGLAPVISGESVGSGVAQGVHRFAALASLNSIYTISIGMVGVLVFMLGILGFLYWISSLLKSQAAIQATVVQELPIVLFAAPLAFLFLNYFVGGSNPHYPPATLANLFNTRFHELDEVNNRYGIQALPFFIIFAALLAKSSKVAYTIVALLAVLQTSSFFTNTVNLAYYLPKHAAYAFPKEKVKVGGIADWLKTHYAGGLVLVSMNANDDKIFYLPIPQKKYIFEGSGKYWRESLVTPQRYAMWAILQNGSRPTSIGGAGTTDLAAYYLLANKAFAEKFLPVYKDDLFVVYKLRGNPDMSLQE